MKGYIISKWRKERMPPEEYAVNGPDGSTVAEVWRKGKYWYVCCEADGHTFYRRAFGTRGYAVDTVIRRLSGQLD